MAGLHCLLLTTGDVHRGTGEHKTSSDVLHSCRLQCSRSVGDGNKRRMAQHVQTLQTSIVAHSMVITQFFSVHFVGRLRGQNAHVRVGDTLRGHFNSHTRAHSCYFSSSTHLLAQTQNVLFGKDAARPQHIDLLVQNGELSAAVHPAPCSNSHGRAQLDS